METVEKLSEINQTLKDLFDFVQNDSQIKLDFDEYLKTIGAKDIPLNRLESVFIPYVFERRVNGNKKTVVEVFEQKNKDNTISKSFLTAQYSIYRIKRILKNGFDLVNLINEKEYRVMSLTRMTEFRGIGIGQFIVARIFKDEENYYLIEITNVLSSTQENDALRYAVMKIIQNPRFVYYDNPEKEKIIKKDIKTMYKKFTETFDTDEILTSNEYADEIIGEFNEIPDGQKLDISKKIVKPAEYKFFEIRELNNNYDNFLENSVNGFSSHSEKYDVAIIFDAERGLYAIPFYQTFCKIFDDSSLVENAKGCVEYFLSNDAVSDRILKRVFDLYPNFMSVINELFGKNYTFKSLLEEYKSDYLKYKIYSSTSVLFRSTVFETSINNVCKDESISNSVPSK